MTCCYIIHSAKLNKFYIGVTQEDISRRIEKHNNASYGYNRFTSKSNDWVLYLFIPTKDYTQAIRIERKIKSMKSSKYIKLLKEYPDKIAQLVSST
jgi:putative endonuclease